LRRAHRQRGQDGDDLREAAREVIALPGEQLHAAVGAPGHDAEAVVLDLVNPAATFGRLPGWAGKTRLDEGCRVGQRTSLKQMAEPGWHADLCLLRPDETAGPDVERRLKAQAYDCVVIGAGIRLPPRSLSMFEAVINAVHRAAPDAAIAFNTRPEDSADAAARWLKAD
jgi:hypothetical protein